MYMGGVDKSDQLRGYYHVRLKSSKNYKFWFMFDVAITNAFLLHRYSPTSRSKTSQAYKQLQLTLAQQLIGTYNSRKQPGRPVTLPSAQRPHISVTGHFPLNHSRKRCMYCKSHRYPSQRSETVCRVSWNSILLPDWKK